MAKQRNARQWATLLRRYQRSGLTQAAFCSRHGIALSTLGYQLRKHRAGADDPKILRGIQLTINGIAAGLRNSG